MAPYALVQTDIQTAFQGIKQCLGKLADLCDGNSLDAEEDGWDMDESDCRHLCLDFKYACLDLEKIQLCLSEIAKFYNKSFITDYPHHFQSFIDAHHAVMKDDALRTLNAVLAMTGAKTGADQHPDTLRLIAQAQQMSQLMDSILKLCHKVRTQEEHIKQNGKKCLEMMEAVVLQAQKDQKGVIELYIQSGITPKPTPPDSGKRMMCDIINQYPSVEEFAAACFHQFSQGDINTYVVQKALNERRLAGLTQEELEWWKDDPNKARDVRYVIEHFDELGVEGNQSQKTGKHIIAAPRISMLMKWAQPQESQSGVSVPKFLKYFQKTYKGLLQLPATSTYHKYKNAYSKEDWQKFTDQITAMLDNRQQKAIQVSI